ncbi:MAG: COX15/CtaA family protein, partial [Planctomycetota bacterium]
MTHAESALPPAAAVPDPTGPRPAGALRPGGAAVAGPNRRLRARLSALLAVLVVLSGLRDPQYFLFTPIPLLVIWLTPRGATRVLLGFALALVTIGGLLTTYREGMAVLEWPRTQKDGMFEYPLSQMLADGWGVTLEHTHRLVASALGLVAIAVVMSTYVHRSRPALKAAAWITLLAIIGQGILGGFRVLEVSQNLAFLHGTIAQAVFATMAVLAAMASDAWRRGERLPTERAARGLGPWVAGLLYLQLGLGAWLRHHGHVEALLVHGTFALVVVALVVVFAKELGAASREGDGALAGRAPLARLQHILLGSLGLQFTLGVLATYG